MSKKFFYFLLTLVLISSLTACKKDSQPAPTTNTTNTTNTATTSTNAGTTESPTTNVTPGTIAPGIANPANPRSTLVNAPAADITLPKDIPTYPGSELKDKKITNMINRFFFTTSANINEISSFYLEALKKEGWDRRVEQTNSVDGLYFVKPKRTVRLIAYRDGKAGKTDYILNIVDLTGNVQDKVQVMDEKGSSKEVKVGNVNDAIKLSYKLPSDVPVYPEATKKATENPGVWWEYKSKDPVKKIASWYAEKLKTSGWGVELDTSELGDSMVIYNKTIENGDKMYVGVRVNDMKKENERWITLINYPINTVIPQVKPISEVEKEQAGAAKSVREQQKKALDAKLKAERESKQSQPQENSAANSVPTVKVPQLSEAERKKKLEELMKARQEILDKKK
jgi:hypothetical protein